MLELNQAQQRAVAIGAELAQRLKTQWSPPQTALGRVLAAPVSAPGDWPSFNSSRMDGYAMRRSDLPRALTQGLLLDGQSFAEQTEVGLCSAGYTWRVQTGAPLPREADVLVPQEDCDLTDLDSGVVRVQQEPELGAWIRPAGSEARAGDVLLPAGIQLRAPTVAMLCGMQIDSVPVREPLRVAVLSLGEEIRLNVRGDANRPLLVAMLRRLGAVPVAEICVGDDLGALQEALRGASSQAHLVISSGGASVGDRDFLRQAVESMGKVDAYRLRLRPGMPMVFATLNGDSNHPTPLIGLPGNPLSVLVLSGLLLAPLLRTAMSMSHALPEEFHAQSSQSVANTGPRDWVLLGARAPATQEQGATVSFPMMPQNSAMLPLLGKVDCATLVPAGQKVSSGDTISCWDIRDW